MRKKYRKLKITSLIALPCIVLLGYMGLTHIAPYAMLQPGRINIELTPSDFGLSYDLIEISGEEGVNLVGYYVKPKTQQPKGVMILLHGIGGCKEHFLEVSGILANDGIASVLLDGRGHGESGGEFISYGFYEKMDISKLVDFIQTKHGHLPIGIWGNSMGGAIAIQALEYDKRINFGVIESTFTELDQIVYDYQKRYSLGIGLRFATDYSLGVAGTIGKFNPDDVKPINSVKNIDQPMFIAHGDSDERISYHYGQQLFETLKSTDKTFELVEGAGHLNMFEIGGEAYRNKILEFISSQL